MTVVYWGSKPEVSNALARACRARGVDFRVVEARQEVLRQSPAVVFFDWPVGASVAAAMALLEECRTCEPKVPAVALVPRSLPALLHRAYAEGVADVLGTPVSQAELEAEVDSLAGEQPLLDPERRKRFEELCTRTLVGRSESLLRALVDAQRAAVCDATVLLLGETGTGKEVFARLIHALSQRASAPYLAVNCASIHRELIESELFGHVKGAYTGADRDRAGILAAAGAGTLLLDEVGDMPVELQIKLLRVIESREYMAVGDHSPRQFSARVIAATSVDLAKAVEQGRFRPDLFGRLNHFQIRIPPLRERREDIRPLIRFFLDKHGQARPFTVSETALELLAAFDYPMNVRQLESAVSSAIARCAPGMVIFPRHLPAEVLAGVEDPYHAALEVKVPVGMGYEQARAAALAQVDRHFLGEWLKAHGGNQKAAAEAAGVDRGTFAARWKAAQERS